MLKSPAKHSVDHSVDRAANKLAANGVSNLFTFEHPLNDAMRICLRIEALYQQIGNTISNTTINDGRQCLLALISLIDAINRPDLKSKLIQSLNQYRFRLNEIKDAPHINQQRLLKTQQELNDIISTLHTTPQRIGSNLRENEFLNAIRLQQASPGGLQDHSNLAYAIWCRLPVNERKQQIEKWLSEISLLKSASEILLHLARDSDNIQTIQCENGFYEQILNQKYNYQLIQITLPTSLHAYPEISAGKHRLYIRFVKTDFSDCGRAKKITDKITFDLHIAKA